MLISPELRAACDVSYQPHWAERWRVVGEASNASVLEVDDDLVEHREARLPSERLLESRPDLHEIDGDASPDAPRAKVGAA